VKIAVLYVGTSVLAPLRKAEDDIKANYGLDLRVGAHNCGVALPYDAWEAASRDIAESRIVFIIHVTDEENASRIISMLDRGDKRQQTVIAFNCMPALMRRTRMGKLDFSTLMKPGPEGGQGSKGPSQNLARQVGSWMADTFKRRNTVRGDKSAGPANGNKRAGHGQYLKLIGRLPAALKFVPNAGKLRDIKHYLNLFCYFLQPTPRNIRSMFLYAIKQYAPGEARIGKVDGPEAMPVVGAYHPDAPELFKSFNAYQKWHERSGRGKLDPQRTIGLLLMRPQIVSDAKKHYDFLIRAIESEGLSVIPAISTFMDNREACRAFFAGKQKGNKRPKARVSQIVSLTGFSFVGGPAMNDSEASVEFLSGLNVPFRSMVSLDFQTIENWQGNRLGLNPVQAAMQVAIPEIDGATEPLIFGGMPQQGVEPVALEDRCSRIARRLARWNRLQTADPSEVRLALLIFCFPPNKGNIGTAADLDVFPSVREILNRLRSEGYTVDVPENADQLRSMLLDGNSSECGTIANVAYRMNVDEYLKLCPHATEIEREWGRAPGNINSNGSEILILGAQFGKVFVGVQPTFGYEGDPMRLLNAESGSPHHGFMALYTFIEKVFCADAVVHVGTHGAMEFMPGKQVGLSERCWPDRLIGELPNVYIYSVNNPSEGTIAKRRSYAELISYLTPPIENAGLYKGLASMKELLSAYRQSTNAVEKEELFNTIQEQAEALNL
jgi:magnesium chelatase subunit H